MAGIVPPSNQPAPCIGVLRTDRKDDVMSNCKRLVRASVAAGLSVPAADAADLRPPPPIVAPVAVAPNFSGWYLRGNICFSNQQVDSLALQPLPQQFATDTIS